MEKNRDREAKVNMTPRHITKDGVILKSVPVISDQQKGSAQPKRRILQYER